MPSVKQVLADMIDGPPLTGAACSGHGALFDDRGNGETAEHFNYPIGHATRICATYPVFTRCAEIADAMPQTGRCGILAGRYYPFGQAARDVGYTAAA